jgi:NhaA family Na+:H+ antiporter
MSDPAQHPPETWAPVRRAAAALAAPVQHILAIEAASGIVLLVATMAALIWANAGGDSYERLWHTPLGGRVGPWAFEQPLRFWIDDGLMTAFFFVVGLEIRREIFGGELASLRTAALPLAAALGGMLVPAGLYALINLGRPTAAGWAVPIATDIAFAVGALTLLGARVAPALRVLLLALAVIDDIGAIVVIALFYSAGIAVEGFAIAALGIAAVLGMRAAGVRSPLLYVGPGAIVWAGLLVAGIHPTLAGVVLGLLAPIRPWFGASGFATTTQAELVELPAADHRELLERLDRIDQARREAVSPGERLIHYLHPWVAYVVMPVFALANAGVVLGDARLSGDTLWLFAGIVAGLAAGKPLGITLAALAARRVGFAAYPDGIGHRGVLLVGLVGGVGFTMSLFVAHLAFAPGPALDTAKLAILVGSGIASSVGLAFGLASDRRGETAGRTA